MPLQIGKTPIVVPRQHQFNEHVNDHQVEFARNVAQRIGDNVFLGWGCTILAGTTIGANTIIGANSVCSGKIDGNSVYAGNPAKKIMTLEEYYLKRKAKQKQEACAFVKDYYDRFHEFPSEG